jgi:hypothetical protein
MTATLIFKVHLSHKQSRSLRRRDRAPEFWDFSDSPQSTEQLGACLSIEGLRRIDTVHDDKMDLSDEVSMMLRLSVLR